MARKTLKIEITAEGRDKGKVFLITEMPAKKVEKWGIRAAMAMSNANLDISPQLLSAGLAGIAVVGIKGLMGARFDDVEPLLDELMTCVEIIPDPDRENVRRSVIEDDLDEVKTIIQLRYEVFKLITGFSLPASLSNMIQEQVREVGKSWNTLTSPLSAEQ